MSVWPLKMLLKVLLSWIPGRHSILRSLGIFRHGEMDSPDYAYKIFKIHAERAFPDGLPDHFSALELGPGDSLLSALIANAHGCKKIFLVDAGCYASYDLKLYKQAGEYLRKKHGLNVLSFENVYSIEDMLKKCNAEYLTDGLASLKSIPENSVDFIWSHSVVEHIRKKDFDVTMKELVRVLKPTGRITHIVDLQDHLDHSLNNLRFSEALWENELLANAGFYTNRIQYSSSLNSMRSAGAQILDTQVGRWEKLPLEKSKMAEPFRHLPEDELCVRTYSVIMKAA